MKRGSLHPVLKRTAASARRVRLDDHCPLSETPMLPYDHVIDRRVKRQVRRRALRAIRRTPSPRAIGIDLDIISAPDRRLILSAPIGSGERRERIRVARDALQIEADGLPAPMQRDSQVVDACGQRIGPWSRADHPRRPQGPTRMQIEPEIHLRSIEIGRGWRRRAEPEDIVRRILDEPQPEHGLRIRRGIDREPGDNGLIPRGGLRSAQIPCLIRMPGDPALRPLEGGSGHPRHRVVEGIGGRRRENPHRDGRAVGQISVGNRNDEMMDPRVGGRRLP